MKSLISTFRILSPRILWATLALTCWGLAWQAYGQNPIAAENSLPGNPKTEWDVNGLGDLSIQGFATDISVNRGEVVDFKIKTDAKAYRIDIYRLGYYGGNGARKVATILPTASLPQSQPAPVNDPVTGLVDCGNWAVSASWAVPANATSGVYIARPVRTDNNGASHVIFIVRDDAGQSDLLFQTSDTKWQAYNDYGGASLYRGNGPGILAAWGRSYKVSYNRPFSNRSSTQTGTGGIEGFLWASEYPMIRWLEANGYNVSYASGVDTDRRGAAALLTHKVFLSVGHDEYWSGQQRANVEAARAAGVHLGFFSANEMFWKTRWENSIAGTNKSYRTLVCYKESHVNAKIDPSPEWTGTWRDPRFSPPSNGGRPENAVSGQLYMVDAFRGDAITIPPSEGKSRFWRNTGIDALAAAGQTVQLPAGVLGFEWDEVTDNGCLPPGMFRLSKTTVTVDKYLQNYSSAYATGSATHSLSLYRHNSGALVFGAGTVQWSWGLDAVHDFPLIPTDIRMQQATVNLFADMGVQPSSLQSWLAPGTQSTDTIPPVSVIQTPPGGTVEAATLVTTTGTSTDAGGGRTSGVEFSSDAGATWHPATGTANWSATWRTPNAPGTVTLMSRAVDDSGRIETPGAGVTITVIPNASGSCSLWPAPAVPTIADQSDVPSLELGVKFKSDRSGWIRAIRFYKCASNTGPHSGHLWTGSGTLLAAVNFTGESAAGWQEAWLTTPVFISAATTYIASYHLDSGHYSISPGYFATSGRDQAPLHAPANGVAGYNGVFITGAAGFPTGSYNSSNYWVDVVFSDVKTTPLPAAPDGLALVSVSGTQVDLAWADHSTNESSFKIERKTGAAGSYVEIATVGVNVEGFTDIAPAINNTYFYRVRAANDGGYSAYSAEAWAATFNTAPVAAADSHQVDQDTTLYVSPPGVLANDTDAQAGPLSAIADAGPAHGSLGLNANGGFSYTPAAGYTGSDSFTYHANDGSLNSNVVTVTLDVLSAAPPILVNGSFESDFTGWTRTGNQLIQTYASSHGTKMVAFNGGQTTPNGVLSQTFATVPGQNYRLSFDLGILAFNSNEQRMQVAVTGNTPLVSQSFSTFSMSNGVVRWLAKSCNFIADSTACTLTFRDISPSSDSIDLLLDHVRIDIPATRTLAVESTPQFGVNVAISPPDNTGAGNGLTHVNRLYPDGTVVSLTAPAISDSYRFQKWLKDGVDYSTVPVTSVPLDEDCRLTAVYLESAPSITTQPVSLTVGMNGSATFRVAATGTGSLSYQWRFNGQNIDGARADTYTVTNARGRHAGTYDVIVANNIGSTTSEAATLSVVSALLANGSFESDFTGWTATGNQAVQSAAMYAAPNGTKVVAFNGAQATPNAVLSQSFATRAGQTYPLAFDIGIIAYNTNLQKLQVTVTGSTGNLLSQLVTVNGQGGGLVRWWSQNFSFVADGASATLVFQDVSTTSDSLDMLLDNVRIDSPVPLNTAPVAAADAYSIARNAALTVAAPGVLANDTDADTDPLTATLDAGPAHGSLALAPNGGFTYTPEAGYEGADSFTYHDSDGSLDSNIVTVGIIPSSDSLTLFRVPGAVLIGMPATEAGRYELLRSRDLIQWEHVDETRLTEPGTLKFIDVVADGEPQMFYRIALNRDG